MAFPIGIYQADGPGAHAFLSSFRRKKNFPIRQIDQALKFDVHSAEASQNSDLVSIMKEIGDKSQNGEGAS
eukprot:7150121-Prymnesium_polylepis.3